MNTFIKKFNTAVIYMFISYIARGNFFRVSQAKTVLNHASYWSDGAFLFLICRHFKSSAGLIYVLWFDYLRLRVLWFFIFEYQLCASVSKNGKKYCFWKHDMAASVFTWHFLSVSLTCLCLCMFVSKARFLYAFPPSWLMHLEAVVEAAVNSPVWNWMLPPCYLRLKDLFSWCQTYCGSVVWLTFSVFALLIWITGSFLFCADTSSAEDPWENEFCNRPSLFFSLYREICGFPACPPQAHI